MSADEAVEALVSWFGYKEFRLKDMCDDWVAETTELAGLHQSQTRRGPRIVVGRFLNSQPFGQRVTVCVVEPAKGSIAAVYQVQPTDRR